VKQNRIYTFVLFSTAILLLVVLSIYRNTEFKKPLIASKNELTPTIENKNKTQKLKEIVAQNLAYNQEMVERTDFDNSVINQERLYTENEIANMTEKEFENLLKDVSMKLPKLSDIKKIPPQALHRTPPPVLQAGRDLGLIKEIINIHERYEIKTIPFYDECSKNNERPVPVRALCLTNLVIAKKKLGLKFNRQEYAPEILDLAKMVTEL
jgi:hypothetical protein